MPASRISVLTFNVWNTDHLAERTPALQDFFTRFDADIICLQEVRPETLALFDKFLVTSHSRISEQKDEPGWMCEGNIYYRHDMFSVMEFGAFDVGMSAKKSLRRQWWANLKLISTGQKIHVSTVHYTWEGHADECLTGVSPRVEYTHATLSFLLQHLPQVDAMVFCGDFNDRYHPRRILQGVNLVDTFSQLGLPMQSTWPTPTWNWTEDARGGVDFVCDWIFTCPRVKTLSAQIVKHAFKGVNPSDHFPLLSVLELKENAAALPTPPQLTN